MSGWTAAVLLVCLLAVPAAGQERYRLDDESYDWEKQTEYDPQTPQGKLQTIRRTLAQGQAKEAEKLAGQWIERYPNHPDVVEAYFLRGDALRARGKHYESLFDYEHVIRRYPASELYMTALEREYEIARLYAGGLRRHLWGMRLIKTDAEAEELFILIQERAPGSNLGERANIALGDFYFERGRMTEAADAYDAFLVNYPQSRGRERAMLRLIQANLASFKGPRFDPTGLVDAGERIKMYAREFPAAAERIGAEALLMRIEESLAAKALASARWYDETGQRVSAIYMYRRTVRDYPQSAAAQQAIERLNEWGVEVIAPDEANAPKDAPPVEFDGDVDLELPDATEEATP